MPEAVLREMRLPFPGLYESTLSAELDRAEEQLVENMAEERGLEIAVVADAMYWAMDHARSGLEVAKEYTSGLIHALKAEGLDLRAHFEDMTSPKYYNFETDRVLVKLPLETVLQLRTMVDEAKLAEVIVERHRSRSGFISFYSDDLATWRAKPVEEWDHNELETLLLAVLRTMDIDLREVEDRVIEDMSGNGEFDSALIFDEAKLEEKLAERQEGA